MLPIGMKPRRTAPEQYSVTYTAVHRRLRAWAGAASEYECVGCGASAVDWSYNGQAKDPLHDEHPRTGKRVEYSADLTDYEPVCRSCHTLRDRWA